MSPQIKYLREFLISFPETCAWLNPVNHSTAQLVAQVINIGVILDSVLSLISHFQFISKSYWFYFQKKPQIGPSLTISH